MAVTKGGEEKHGGYLPLHQSQPLYFPVVTDNLGSLGCPWFRAWEATPVTLITATSDRRCATFG